MIICSCKAVSDRRLQAEVDDGARSLADLARRCGAGSDCGSCAVDLLALVRSRRGLVDRDSPPSLAK